VGGTAVSDESFALLLEFDRGSTDFRDGFELGRLWALAQEQDEEFTETVHVSNAEMLLRIGEATRREVSWEETVDGYAEVTFAAPPPESEEGGER